MITLPRTDYVVICDEWPDSVFSTQEAANAYVERKKAWRPAHDWNRRSHWTVRPFVVDAHVEDGAA